MRILFVIPGPIEWATSRFRAYWLKPHLEEMGHSIEIAEFGPWMNTPENWRLDVLEKTDAVIFLKQFDPLLEKADQSNLTIVWDVTDPMWWFSPNAFRQIVHIPDYVAASSMRLASDFTKWSGGIRAYTIPDTMELEHYALSRNHDGGPDGNDPSDPVKIVWFGLGANRFSIMGGMAALDRLAANGHHFSLTVVDNVPTQQMAAGGFEIEHVAFDLETENAVIASHDIALLPKYPGPWGRVKSNNKDLTAWACNLPVSRGMDYQRLEEMVTDPGMRQEAGWRKYVEDNWTPDVAARKLERLLKGEWS